MIFIALFVLALLHGYVGWRIIPTLQVSSTIQIILWTLLVVMTLLPLVSILLRFQGFENTLTDILSWIAYTGLGFIVLAFFFSLAKDVGLLAWFGGSKLFVGLKAFMGNGESAATPFDPERRRLFVSGLNLGILGVTGGLTAYGFFQARREQRIEHVPIPIADLPETLEGFRIVQISDLHVGPTIKRDFVQRVVEDVRGLDPDLIAFTGDMVDGSVRHLNDDVEPLRDLKAPYGTYFITGNHEYYSGVEQWVDKANDLGFRVLLNEHQTLDLDGARITIAGVNDLHAHQIKPEHRCDVDRALAGAPDDSIKILLAHQPGSIDDARRLGVHLQLSGHTHGGQFKPFTTAVAMAHPYYKGLHDHDGTWIYVNSGTGYWGPPLRIGVPSEITVLTLTRA